MLNIEEVFSIVSPKDYEDIRQHLESAGFKRKKGISKVSWEARSKVYQLKENVTVEFTITVDIDLQGDDASVEYLCRIYSLDKKPERLARTVQHLVKLLDKEMSPQKSITKKIGTVGYEIRNRQEIIRSQNVFPAIKNAVTFSREFGLFVGKLTKVMRPPQTGKPFTPRLTR